MRKYTENALYDIVVYYFKLVDKFPTLIISYEINTYIKSVKKTTRVYVIMCIIIILT